MEVKRRTAKSLVAKLGSVSEQSRDEALRELRLITKHDADSRALIADAGAVPFLAETLYSSAHEAQENAAATLLNLSINAKESVMSTRGLLDALSHLLRRHTSSSSATAVQSAAATLHSLLVFDSYRPIIGAKRDIVYALIDIVKSPTSPIRSVKDALKALFGISLYPLNRSTMIQLGVVPALFGLILKDGRVGLIEDTTAVIAQVAGCEESEEAFQKVSGFTVLIDLLDDSTGSSMRIKENAVSALLNLARCGGERVLDDVRNIGLGVFDGIDAVAEKGTPKGKSKAHELLSLIDNRSSSGGGDGSNGSMFRDARFDYLFHRAS